MSSVGSSARLILINGAPGSGKSTLTVLLAAQHEMMLSLDVDAIKHSLGGWRDDPSRSSLQAQRLAVALDRAHLVDGHEVAIGQYLGHTAFIDELERLAHETGAVFVEVILDLDPETLASRLQHREAAPSRPEHAVNSRFVGPEDAGELVESIAAVGRQRPRAHHLDAAGTGDETLRALTAMVSEALT